MTKKAIIVLGVIVLGVVLLVIISLPKSDYEYIYHDDTSESLNGLTIPSDLDIVELSSEDHGAYVWIKMKVRGTISPDHRYELILKFDDGMDVIEYKNGIATCGGKTLFAKITNSKDRDESGGDTLNILSPKGRIVDISARTIGIGWQDYVNEEITVKTPSMDIVMDVKHENGCYSDEKERTTASLKNGNIYAVTVVTTSTPCYNLKSIDVKEVGDRAIVNISLKGKKGVCVQCLGYQRIEYVLEPTHQISNLIINIEIDGRIITQEANVMMEVEIGDINENPSIYKGKKVIIDGIYLGWHGPGAPPVTRSDWGVCDGTGEIYVTGSIPEAEIGEEITVTGTVMIKDDTPYIKAEDIILSI